MNRTADRAAEKLRTAQAHHKAGRLREAETVYRQILATDPMDPGGLNGLGILACQVGKYDAAVDSLRLAVMVEPTVAAFRSSLGDALAHLNRLDEAEAEYRTALRLDGKLPEVHSNLGSALTRLGRFGEAEESCRRSIALRPRTPQSHLNLAYVLLLTGRFIEGWQEFEWRLQQPEFRHRSATVPVWNGEPLLGRTLLVYREQGLGDSLQFLRYLPLLPTGTRVVVELQPELMRLASATAGSIEWVASDAPLPHVDRRCPLLSLPRLLGTTVDTIPASVPYLKTDPMAIAGWRERLAKLPGLRVGLVWAGNPALGQAAALGVDHRRSVSLAQLAPLASVPGVSFVSLQKGAAAAASSPPQGLIVHDWTEDLHDFADTAALIEALDLVISVDTSVVHLAGALGKPIWLLNRFDTCWRWLLERDDSPWYPTLRQFRQTRTGHWQSVILSVRNALAALARTAGGNG